ncbi:MAG: twin-arginine translocation signal domain-containing protein [bacterium]|nr:twin-arginine translocation signal domain-containing protein [bacterium]
MSGKNVMNRRNFLRNSAAGLGALGASSILHAAPGVDSEKKDAPKNEIQKTWKIKEYRTLGRTGFKVSDISTGIVKIPALLEQLLDAGVNYIDTAEAYQNEEVVGSVIKNRDRKKLFVSSKLVLKKGEGKDEIIARTNKCLERLQTTYLDCMMHHGCKTVADVAHPGFHEAMIQLKKEGKVRFLGISNHGSNFYTDSVEAMEKVLTAAALDGRYDVMLLAYNFVQDDKGAEVLKLCRKKNIGTTLMKTNPIGNIYLMKDRIAKLKKEGKEIPPRFLTMITRMEAKAKRAEAFMKKYKLDNPKRLRDAATRFCLSNSDVHSVCCTFRNFEDIDLFLPLSGTKLQDMEKKTLAAYKEECGSLYCRHACGLCEPSCPKKVPVNRIMRYNHYFDAQNREKHAMSRYAALKGPKADLCKDCRGFCESACPHGVSIHGLLNVAHQNLTIT